MPFTTVGWTASQDSAVLLNLGAIADPHIRIDQVNNIIVPEGLDHIVMAFGSGVNITRAQLISPSLRQFVNHEIEPLDVSASPSSPYAIQDLRSDPIVVAPNEQLTVQAAENGAGATRQNVLIWLADGPITPVDGEIRSVRFTAAVAAVAFAWTNMAITLDQNLPAGRYALVGARCESTTPIAFRFVFVGGIWRPGAIGVSGPGRMDDRMFRMGNMGVWGEFAHNVPPTLDVLCGAADAAFAGVLDLIRL